MAVDMFLKIDGIDGDSVDRDHLKWIDIQSFSWGASNPVTSFPGGGGGAGKVSISDLNFMMLTNTASPELFRTCATGEHIKSAELSLRRDSERPEGDFYKLKLSDVLVTSYQASGSEAEIPSDSVSLNFVKIDFQHVSFDKGTNTEG